MKFSNSIKKETSHEHLKHTIDDVDSNATPEKRRHLSPVKPDPINGVDLKKSMLIQDRNILETQIEVVKAELLKMKKKIKRLKFQRRVLIKVCSSQSGFTLSSGDESIDFLDENIRESEEEDEIAPTFEPLEILDTPTKEKKKKKKRDIDPDAPKRPANAYMLFCQLERANLKDERDKLRSSMPGSEEEVALSNLTKALGVRWKNLSDVERQRYQDMFKEKVKDYNEKIVEYSKHNVVSQSLECIPSEGVSKRPANAYSVFCESKRQALIEECTLAGDAIDDESIAKALALKWRNLSPDERKGRLYNPVFQDQYSAQVREYDKNVFENPTETICD